MGKKDLLLKSYLSDPARYADVYNGSVFGGMQVLRAEQLEKAESVQTKSDGGISLERICDLVMRQNAKLQQKLNMTAQKAQEYLDMSRNSVYKL